MVFSRQLRERTMRGFLTQLGFLTLSYSHFFNEAHGQVKTPSFSKVEHMNTFWKTSLYWNALFEPSNGVSFSLNTSEMAQRASGYVPTFNTNKSFDQKKARFFIDKTTCIVDEGHRHTSGTIGHFSRRILPWYSIETFQGDFCDRFFLTRTPREPLSQWFSFMITAALGVGRDIKYTGDVKEHTLFEKVKINFRTYWFRNSFEATHFQAKAFSLLHPSQRRGGICLFTRRNGRNPLNMANVREALHDLFGSLIDVSVDQQTPVADQVFSFSQCDLLVSPHGSHNTNVMFMRAGSAFMELNPFMFYHNTYHQLATLMNVTYLNSRNNFPQNVTRLREWQNFTDVQCQRVKKCRMSARSTRYYVNIRDMIRTIQSHINSRLGNTAEP
ncbi:hypothetical protein DUNSADRAFT_5582 [Dunaliella salina]|uniref:Glycosyltransferase 61 catalytic domain-containing protein n=1 Tax=Dunaliella salina TaxID=3046 RepID=A0ABQ7FUM6_DUNSA|nr:hypothetical protein DUNSADRAFT_5582 [Dunaliella salina]|eukprot:KAF5825983.1 hypothetical protein DUNSADRAFT_5582 [Dunaliella salina]